MSASLLSPRTGAVLFAALSSLNAALAGPIEGRQTTEDATTSTASVSTITGYAHPLTRLALGTLAEYQTPLSYASPPTAITVPTRLVGPGDKRAEATAAQAEAEAPLKTDAPSGEAVCTSIAGSYPTATIPNFCNPSAQVNAPSFVAGRSDVPTATVTIGAVSNKLDCCVQCANIFNCVAWRFVPVYSGAPNPHIPGGFDPWGRGDCEAVYHTGDPEAEAAAGTIPAASDAETANLCPNGKVGEMLAGSENKGSAGASGTTNSTGSWMNLYYNGWNEGPCAEPVAPFESGLDAGRGDAADLCT